MTQPKPWCSWRCLYVVTQPKPWCSWRCQYVVTQPKSWCTWWCHNPSPGVLGGVAAQRQRKVSPEACVAPAMHQLKHAVTTWVDIQKALCKATDTLTTQELSDSRWPSCAPVPNKPSVSVDIKQHFNNHSHSFRVENDQSAVGLVSGREQRCRCHCEPLRAHAEMRRLSVHTNK